MGESLKPIVETTVPWDVVEPRYATQHDYRMGRGTWSWILWQDGSINYDDQVRYIDLAAAMGYEYVLIDNWWDTYIGRERMEDLIKYAHSKKLMYSCGTAPVVIGTTSNKDLSIEWTTPSFVNRRCAGCRARE